MIEIEDLNVWFGSRAHRHTVLEHVSLAVPRGESFGLVGESGSGKSTLLRTMVGLNKQWSGRIGIDGIDARIGNRRSLLQRVQMVFQDPFGSLHPRHTVMEAIGEPLVINGRRDRQADVIALLEAIGLDASYAARYPQELSGGQRQRVAIARAIALNPPVLLLDEPTSALDVSIQAEVLNLLSDLQRSRNLTFLFVSHDLGVIAHMCERLAVMKDGRIVEILTRDDLRGHRFSHPYTAELVEASRVLHGAPAMSPRTSE